MARKSKATLEQELISEVKTFMQEADAASSKEREYMSDDLKFVYDEEGQWDRKTLQNREGRPSYTYNRCIGSVNQVIGEQRMFRPQIKLRGVDDNTDQELAEIMGGLVRNIEAISDAESTYDMAFKFAVAGGFGAWRVVTDYQNDHSFEQEVFIRPIHNPFTVFFDPLALDPCKRDQTSCVIAERVSKEFYIAKYGKEGVDIMSNRDSQGWLDEKGVRIAEFFKKVPVEKEIALMSDGRTVPYDDNLKSIEEDLTAAEDAAHVVKTRKVSTFQVKWWKVDGLKVLEGPITYDWQFIPVVKMPGRYINIEGEQKTQSLIRHAKDAQKTYNYNRTTMAETVANAPRQPYMTTPAMIKGYEGMWAKAGADNRPYLLYNPDPKAPTLGPQRVTAAEVPNALVALAAQDADDIKQATGFFDASLGKQGNEVSGQAIKARSRQADVGSYEFYDNFKKAMKLTGDILLDIIPTVYDTERTVRILGLDGTEEFKKINAYDEATDKTHDLSQGQYDVTVDIGPTFSTRREESFQTLLESADAMPIVAEIAPDLIMKNLDVPGGDELVTRLRKKLIAQGIVEPNEDEAEDMQPAQPDPVQSALVEGEMAKAELNKAKTAKTEAETAEIVNTLPAKVKQGEADVITSTINTIRGNNSGK